MPEKLDKHLMVTATLMVEQMDLDPDEWGLLTPPKRRLTCPDCIDRLISQFPCDVSEN